MMKIWKYPLAEHLVLPKGAKVVKVGETPRRADGSQVWVCFESEHEHTPELRVFKVVGTGQGWSDDEHTYVTSWFDGPFVWHLLEERGPA